MTMIPLILGMAALCFFLLMMFLLIIAWELLIFLMFRILPLLLIMVSIMSIGVIVSMYIDLRTEGSLSIAVVNLLDRILEWLPTPPTLEVIIRLRGFLLMKQLSLLVRATMLCGRT